MSCFIVEPQNIARQTAFISLLLNDSGSAYGRYHVEAPASLEKALQACYDGKKYDPHKIYRALYIMNLRAYNGRYNDSVKEFTKYAPAPAPAPSELVPFYKSLQCYLYQCAEDPVYKPDLYNAIEDLKNRIAACLSIGLLMLTFLCGCVHFAHAAVGIVTNHVDHSTL